MPRVRRSAIALGLTLILPVVVRGQWEVVYLHPEGAESSDVYAAAGSLQGGTIEVLDGYIYNDHPVIWNRSPEDYVDLLPQGWRMGRVNGMDGPCQVGYVSSSVTDAALWTGSPESFIDLRPGGDYGSSIARAVAASQQVGYAYFSATGMPHAALWYGTAESFLDLHPAVARWSEALATDGVRQGGRVQLPAQDYDIHAALWEGSAESFIDMNPEGARDSAILAMADGVQVGWALFGGQDQAVLWRGSPESFVNMRPAGAMASRLHGTTGTIHAGYTSFSGWAEAGIWTGDDPDSFENLHQYLAPEYFVSEANSVSLHGGWLYIGGAAAETWGHPRAILWKRPIAQPIGSPTEIQPRQILPRP